MIHVLKKGKKVWGGNILRLVKNKKYRINKRLMKIKKCSKTDKL